MTFLWWLVFLADLCAAFIEVLAWEQVGMPLMFNSAVLLIVNALVLLITKPRRRMIR
jgi:hypothetical protein